MQPTNPVDLDALVAELRQARARIAELERGQRLAVAQELERLRDHIQEYIGPDDARDEIRRICWNRAKDLREGR